MARAEEIGSLIAREAGKPLVEGKGEAYHAGQFFTYFAAEALHQLAQTADSERAGIESDTRHTPGFPPMPSWFRDNRDSGQIEARLSAAGFSPNEVGAVMGGNWASFSRTALACPLGRPRQTTQQNDKKRMPNPALQGEYS